MAPIQRCLIHLLGLDWGFGADDRDSAGPISPTEIDEPDIQLIFPRDVRDHQHPGPAGILTGHFFPPVPSAALRFATA
jgi:hypothetical protein